MRTTADTVTTETAETGFTYSPEAREAARRWNNANKSTRDRTSKAALIDWLAPMRPDASVEYLTSAFHGATKEAIRTALDANATTIIETSAAEGTAIFHETMLRDFRAELDRDIARAEKAIARFLEQAAANPGRAFESCDDVIRDSAELRVLKVMAAVYDHHVSEGCAPRVALHEVVSRVENEIERGASEGSMRSTSQTSNLGRDMETRAWASQVRWNTAVAMVRRGDL